MNPFQSSNQQDAGPDPEKVTRLLFRVQDGRLFERTGEKRQLRPGEYHWCDGTSKSPIEYIVTFWKPIEARGITGGTPCSNCGQPRRYHSNRYHDSIAHDGLQSLQCPHVCPIWELAEDQTQDETLLHPKGIEWAADPIDRLIQKVELTRESVEDSDILTRAAVLGSLYQAKALGRVVENARLYLVVLLIWSAVIVAFEVLYK
jgi:hypothetical protein